MLEKNKPISKNALEILGRSLIAKDSNLKKLLLSIGEAGGSSDWHDNAALDQAHRDTETATYSVAVLTSLLRQVYIVEPRQDIRDVGVGNTIVVSYQGEDEEKYTLLGEADVKAGIPGRLSVESPLGQAIQGKKKGETVTIMVNDGTRRIENKYVIKDILPGDF